MTDPRKYDNTFFSIIQNEGNIDGFLDAVFGFLYRGTDFYRLMTKDQQKMGFPPGVAEKKTLQLFKKYEKLAKEDEAQREKPKQKKKPVQEPAPQPSGVTPAVREEGVGNIAGVSEGASKDKSQQPSASEEERKPASQKNTTPQSQGERGKPAKPSSQENKKPQSKEKGDDEDDDDPELTKLQKEYQSQPESYNGADRGTYVWSQSITDCDVRVRIPKHITKGKECEVKIARKHLKVSAKSESGEWQVLVDNDLIWDVNLEESMWTLVPHEYVHVNLEKVQERWWEAVFVNEPHINVRKIDPSRPITDLDDEAQAKIEEMMFNEHQKRIGKPQSHELKVHDMLKEAWNKEGSPFKGTPFDPSKVSISPSGEMQGMP